MDFSRMLGLFHKHDSKNAILDMLERFESSCLGQIDLSQDEFKKINEELSMQSILAIGSHKIARSRHEDHLIWIAPDHTHHDLGAFGKINVMRECPGFHKTRSLLLGHKDVVENGLIDIPSQKKSISMVKLKDGSIGYGPNYRLALRNAALKMHLKRQFRKANPLHIWKRFYGNA